MRRSVLEHKFYKDKSSESCRKYKKQKNYTNKLLKKEKKHFTNLRTNNFTDNKKFWNTVKPLFSNKGDNTQNITLVKDKKIISDDVEVAQTFNQFFKESVKSLNINENKILQNDTGSLSDHVEIALRKFENHPSINNIKNMVNIDSKFSFSKIATTDVKVELKSLKTKKASTFMGVPSKQLKQVTDIILEPLTQIWNIEVIDRLKFPTRLKYADITPIFKKLERVFEKNYRPVSILPVVSKIFERIMQKQIMMFVGNFYQITYVDTEKDIIHNMHL